MKDKHLKLGVVSGLCLALVAVAWAANLLPSYAPGQNPPSLAQAPLIYRMAGTTDLAQFDPARESLVALSDTADTILTTLTERLTMLEARITELETSGDNSALFQEYTADLCGQIIKAKPGTVVILPNYCRAGGYCNGDYSSYLIANPPIPLGSSAFTMPASSVTIRNACF